MLEMKVTDNTKDALGEIERMQWRAARLDPALAEIGSYMRSVIVRRFTRGRDSQPGQPPTVRQGLLRQSISYRVLSGISVAWGSNQPYAWKQHIGGIIRPKNKKFLAVPIDPISIKGTRQGMRVKDFGDLFFVKSKHEGEVGGYLARYVMGKSRGKETVKGIRFLFKLVKKVRLWAHPWLHFAATMDEHDMHHRKIDGILTRWIVTGRAKGS